MCENCCTPFIEGEGCSSALQKRASNVASGDYSCATGHGTIAANEGELSAGRYNRSNDGQLFSVGIGTSDSNRMNAIQVNADGSTSFLYNGRLVKLSEFINNINQDANNLLIQIIDGYLKYSTDGGQTWNNIIALSELKGDDGQPGQDGRDGASLVDVTAQIGTNDGGNPSVVATYNNGTLNLTFNNIVGSGGGSYTLPVATSETLGGVMTGFSNNDQDRTYGLNVTSDGRAYVYVPWSGGGNGGGQPGGHWEQAYRATASNVVLTPENAQLPDIAIVDSDSNALWKHYAPNNVGGTLIIWMAVRWVTGAGAFNPWNGPWQISGPQGTQGIQGDAGIDGDKIEFIYCHTTDEETVPPLSEAAYGGKTINDDDFVPQGWYDNAHYDQASATSYYRVVWFAMREKIFDAQHPNGQWSHFIGPFPWTIWGKNGMDGDGVEYIFYTGSIYPVGNINLPHTWDPTTTEFQTNHEFIPTGSDWVDDPIDPDKGEYIWVSIRKRHESNGEMVWDAYSEPVVWSYNALDGDAGIGIVADLDNDTMAVPVQQTGYNYAYGPQKAFPALYNGPSEVSGATITSMTVLDGTTDITSTASWVTYANPNTSASGKMEIIVNIPVNTINLEGKVIKVKAIVSKTENAGTPSEVTITRPCVLQIFGVNFGTDGSSYTLIPGASVIHKHLDNSRNPSTLSPTIIKVSGDNVFTPYTPSQASPLGFTIKYAIDSNSATTLSGNTIAAEAISQANTSIRLELHYDDNGTDIIVDQETLYVVSDGATGAQGPAGDSALSADLTNEVDGVAVGSDGILSSSVILTTELNLTLGTAPQAITSITPDIPSAYSGKITVNSQSISTGKASLTITIDTTNGSINFSNVNSIEIPINVASAKGNRTVTYTIIPVKAGVDGHVYKLVPSVDVVLGTYSGSNITYDPPTVSCARYLKSGAGQMQTSSEGTLKYSVDGGTTLSNYSTDVSVSSALTAGRIIFYWYIDNILVDRETVPIIKDGFDAQGANGKDAIPIRMRRWSDVYGQTLTGNNKIFSGFETNAPFKDILVITGADYEGAAASCPFTETYNGNSIAVPTAIAVNYDSSHETGFNGTELSTMLPIGGVGTKNYSDSYPATKQESIAQRAESPSKIWYVFQSYGAIYVQLLAADQAYINKLTASWISTNNGNNSYIEIEDGLIKFHDASGKTRIIIGQATGDSTPVLKFYDSDGTAASGGTPETLGTLLYDLGPAGIMKGNNVFTPAEWKRIFAYKNTAGFTIGDTLENNGALQTLYQYYDAYRFVESAAGSNIYAIQYLDIFAPGGFSGTHSALDEKYFSDVATPTTSNYYNMYAPAAYYIMPPGSNEEDYDQPVGGSAPVSGNPIVYAQGFRIQNASSGDPRLQTVTPFTVTLEEIDNAGVITHEITAITW